MEVRTCVRCKKLFQHVTGPTVCPVCKQKEEDLFKTVKEFLRENKGATVEQVSEATGASVHMIEKFLREGRIEVAESSSIRIHCERCHAQILSGKYCAKCKNELSQDLENLAKGMQGQRNTQQRTESKAQMRYFNKK